MFYRTEVGTEVARGDGPVTGHGLPRDPFKALIVPRPIGWISSLSASGEVNLAPYSFFNAVSDRPPMVMFGANGRHSQGLYKDTLKNIQETGEFVCNLATFELRDAMNRSSQAVAREVDEFELAGLTTEPGESVKVPRVKQSPVHLECRWLHSVALPCTTAQMSNNVVFGQVVGIHISDSVLTDGLVDIAKLQPIARLGYLDYAVITESFSMTRPG